MGRVDELLRAMMFRHGKRIAKEVVGDMPDQTKQARRDIRAIQKTLAALTKQVERLLEQRRTEAPVLAAPEEEVEKVRFTKRTLPALRKRFGLTQQELARLLQVGAMTTGIWERGETRPRGKNVARIAGLRSMSQEQVDAALEREPASPAMTPQQIKGIREKLGLARGELAELLGVSAAAVKTWELGGSSPGASNRASLAQIKAMTREEVDKRLGRTGGPTVGTEPATQTALSPKQIRDIRKRAELSQGALAKKLGVSVNSISNWETGQTSPRAKSIEKLLGMRK